METIANLLHYALSFALVLSVIVFIHEYGHFLAARLCGVKVEIFSIGFGREIIGRTDRHGTRWKLAILPLGGFVKMYGDAGASSKPDLDVLTSMSETEKRQSFHYRPLWAKGIIVAAGPLANFLLSIAVFTYFIFTVGISSTQPIVGEIMPNTPAAAAGLQTGDFIRKVDGKRMKYFNDIPEAIAINLGESIELEVERGKEIFTLHIVPTTLEEKDAFGNPGKRPLIGIRSQKLTFQDVGFFHAIGLAVGKTYQMCEMSLKAMGQMITGDRSARELKGPIGIAKLSGDAASQGETTGETARTLLWFIALLSANLGLINLLPVPMLDGGHLAFYVLEGLRGRPLAERVMEYSYRAGFALVISLMAFSLFNDIRQMF